MTDAPNNHATVFGSVLVGMTPHEVRVSAGVSRGQGTNAELTIRGLSDAAAREARIRVRSALVGFGIDAADVALSDVPAGADTTSLDLPIAVAILRAAGWHVDIAWSPSADSSRAIFIGELSLTGELRPVRGALCHADLCRNGERALILPHGNAWEAGLVDAPLGAVLLAKTLGSLTATDARSASEPLEVSKGTSRFAPHAPHAPHGAGDLPPAQRAAFDACRDALAIHSRARGVLLVGSPGSGMTTIARRLGSELSALTHGEALDVARIYGSAGLVGTSSQISSAPPFRAPHHTVSEAGLVGGGERPRPGEVTLAHQGVLFLDELGEFRRPCIDALAGVLKQGEARIMRKGVTTSFPARPRIVVGSSVPCPCGYLQSSVRACRCSPFAQKLFGERLDEAARKLGIVRVEVSS